MGFGLDRRVMDGYEEKGVGLGTMLVMMVNLGDKD